MKIESRSVFILRISVNIFRFLERYQLASIGTLRCFRAKDWETKMENTTRFLLDQTVASSINNSCIQSNLNKPEKQKPAPRYDNWDILRQNTWGIYFSSS